MKRSDKNDQMLDDAVFPPPAEEEEEGADVVDLEDERDALAEGAQTQYLRLMADYDNLRRRSRQEMATARLREREEVLRAFLPVMDNFDRALMAPGSEDNAWLEGMQAVRRQMLETMERLGARRMEAVGEPFDPNRHEAVAMMPSEQYEEGTVIEEVQTGYTIEQGDDVGLLREAKVVVAR